MKSSDTQSTRNHDCDRMYSDPLAWAKLKLLFADDPIITESLKAIEVMAGNMPVRLIFAAALWDCATTADQDEVVQLQIGQMLAEAQHRKFKLQY